MMKQTDPYPLNEVDRFMWSADRTMRRTAGRGNLCVLLLHLHEPLTLEKLEEQVDCSAFHRLYSLRLKRSFTGQYHWKPGYGSPIPHCSETVLTERVDWGAFVSSWDLDPRVDPPVQIKLFQTMSGSSSLACLWHHSLFDAHGAEQFFHSLLTNKEPPEVETPSTSTPQIPLRELEPIRQHILSSSQGTHRMSRVMTSPSQKRLQYRIVQLSSSETETVDALCTSLGLDLFKSCLYIAASSCAAHLAFPANGDDFYIPVPHDTRRSKVDAAPLRI
jgi:hypothetical protein